MHDGLTRVDILLSLLVVGVVSRYPDEGVEATPPLGHGDEIMEIETEEEG